uniref:type IX secretion system membrane protein PorP/SprF n=1 Tax=Algoriphagus halophilus TaxID=226505 RepID=UPI004037E49F
MLDPYGIRVAFHNFRIAFKTTKLVKRFKSQLNNQINEQILVTVSVSYCFFSICCLGLQINAFGQDPQYSQYYAAPLYLNPAMTGES